MRKYGVIFLFLPCLLLAITAQAKEKKITVAPDGSGDYRSLQAAFDAVAVNNRKPVTILVKSGVYKEKLVLDSSKPYISLVGEDAFNTILTYDDHTGKRDVNGTLINTQTSASFIMQAAHFTAVNITFQNDAGFTAGQAVAAQINGDKAAFYHCRFVGNQDVLLTGNAASRQYYKDCYIEGTTDFIFGAATAWFQNCHIHSKKNSHITAASTPAEHPHGYVFYGCVLTGDTALRGVSLGRPWRAYASVTYIHCYLGPHILPSGWNNWNGNTANEATARYAEYQSYGPGAQPGMRYTWTHQLTHEAAKEYTVEKVLSGWTPPFEMSCQR